MSLRRISSLHLVAAIGACGLTAIIARYPGVGLADQPGTPLDLSTGESPARIQLARLLSAINGGETSLGPFLHQALSPRWRHAPDSEKLLRWRRRSGSFQLLHIFDVTPNYLVTLVCSAESVEMFSLKLEVELMQPHRVIYFKFDTPTRSEQELGPCPQDARAGEPGDLQ